MKRRFFISGWLVIPLLTGGLPLMAQQTIVFSKPADASADKANSFMDSSRSSRVNADSYKAPKPFFQDYSPSPALPAPIYYQNNDASVREALNKRKNWTLLTPEQILGIQTPEQILGVDDAKGDKKLSLEEQFLRRQDRSSGTNNRALTALTRRDDENPFGKKREDQNSYLRGNEPSREQNMPSSPASYFDRLSGAAAQNAYAPGKERENSAWASSFAQPTAAKPTPEQVASMDRFRAMMEPTAPPVKKSEPDRWISATPAADPYLQPQPKVNPAGMGILDNSARPTGIQPLPSVTGPAKTPQTVRPAWQAQLPPWLSDKPQANKPKRY